LRAAGRATRFSRKVGFRTIGENRTSDVQAYIQRQVDKEQFVDPGFAEFLKQFSKTDDSVHLDQPTETNSGRYWYNLHLVLVFDRRIRYVDRQSLETLDRTCELIARKKRYATSVRSLMPDHLHLALRGNIEHSPNEIALLL
jgi:REP element-mobilizing transposase RayT